MGKRENKSPKSRMDGIQLEIFSLNGSLKQCLFLLLLLPFPLLLSPSPPSPSPSPLSAPQGRPDWETKIIYTNFYGYYKALLTESYKCQCALPLFMKTREGLVLCVYSGYSSGPDSDFFYLLSWLQLFLLCLKIILSVDYILISGTIY